MKLLSVYVGLPQEVLYQGRTITTGIFKQPVTGSAKVNPLNIEGDQQADLSVHGGADKAVYAYPAEHYDFWKTARPDLEFSPGAFGENLSVSGLLEREVCIGDVYRIGTTVLSVTSPRMPCFKLGIKMKDPTFVKGFLKANRNGFYLRVLETGTVEAGDAIETVRNDGHHLTVEEVAKLYTVEKGNRKLLRKAITSPSLPADWTRFFQKKLDRLE